MSELFLRIYIENKSSVELNVLATSLNGIASQYENYIKKKSQHEHQKTEKLFIQKVDRGSIIIDLVVATVPLLQEFNTIVDFGYYLRDSFDFFLGKSEKKYDYTKKDCQDFSNCAEVVARDKNGAN